jgi:hypothetical protein
VRLDHLLSKELLSSGRPVVGYGQSASAVHHSWSSDQGSVVMLVGWSAWKTDIFIPASVRVDDAHGWKHRKRSLLLWVLTHRLCPMGTGSKWGGVRHAVGS